jgi:hypothetical protein
MRLSALPTEPKTLRWFARSGRCGRQQFRQTKSSLNAPEGKQQMSHGASQYPVSLLIARLIAESGGSLVGFIQALGYRNIERGVRRLEPWITTGEGFPRIVKQIAAVHPAIAVELKLALAATTAMKRAEAEAAWLERCKAERATFLPYLHVDGEKTVPQGICLFGITGGRWNLIEIPPHILYLPLDVQLLALPDLMRAYLNEFHGHCPFFGRVRGFKYVRLIDYFQFNQEGVLIGQVHEPFRRGHVEVSFV